MQVVILNVAKFESTRTNEIQLIDYEGRVIAKLAMYSVEFDLCPDDTPNPHTCPTHKETP